MRFFVLSLMLTACSNPMLAIEKDTDRFLNEHPNNFGFVESEQRKVHYAWSGDRSKPPILFVHGSPGTWKAWSQFLLNENLQKNYHVLAIDRLGYGDSGKGLTEVSLQKQAQAALAVLATNKSHLQAILIGHSYGGPVIAQAAMLNPEKISGLIFVAGSVDPELEKIKWFQYPASWWPIKHLIPLDLKVCNEEIFPLKAELLKQEGDWQKIMSKVAIIQGDEDNLVPPQNADFLIRKLKKDSLLSVEKIPKQGHFVPWERPDLILKAIASLGTEQEGRSKQR